MPRKLTDTTAVQDQATAATVKDQTHFALVRKLHRVAETYPSGVTGWEGWASAVEAVLSTPQVPLAVRPLPLSQDGVAIYALEPGGHAAVLEYTVTRLHADTDTQRATCLVAAVLELRDRMSGPL